MGGKHKEMTKDNHSSRHVSTLDLCYIAIFTAVIAVLAQISIPMPAGVPMTLQTFAVPLAGMVLGKRKGTWSVLLYLLLAAAGVPVLAGLKGGIGVLFGVTGGFLFSFPLMAYLAGWGEQIAEDGSLSPVIRHTARWSGLVLGAVLNYAAGTIWFMFAAQAPLAAALSGCVLPFLPTAVAKIVLVALTGPVLRRALLRAGLLTTQAGTN